MIIHICIYIYIYTYIYIYVFTHTHIYIYIHMSICIEVHIMISYPVVVHQKWPNQCMPFGPAWPGLEDESPLADRPGMVMTQGPNGWFTMEHPFDMDVLGVAPFQETPIWQEKDSLSPWISSKI